MKLIVPEAIRHRLEVELRNAGTREIGGVLMAEHVGPDTFRLHDVTVQTSGGTFATFVRVVDAILAPLRKFFEETNHSYDRFNYLGEWHSHHSFALHPSPTDEVTMLEILLQPDLAARFVALLLVRLEDGRRVQFGLTVYTKAGLSWAGNVVVEETVRRPVGE